MTRERDLAERLLDLSSEGICGITSGGLIEPLNAAARVLIPRPTHFDQALVLERARGRTRLTLEDLASLRSGTHDVQGHLGAIAICGQLRRDEREPRWLLFFRDDCAHQKMIEDLRASRDQAIEAARVKAEFLANMSHELRTPLNGVIAMIGLLLDTNLSNEQQDYARTVRSSADSLLAVINDVLDLSKLESGRIEIENVQFDLRRLIEDAGDMLAPLAAEKNVELVIDIDPGVPERVHGDPARLRQVLLNLVNNAIKFTHQGSVVLRAERLESTDQPCHVRFEVRDTGIGIPRDRIYRLFRSFSQIDASTTRQYGGTGLGLVISKKLTAAMGGDIRVESEVGVGSAFSFAIPLQESFVTTGQQPQRFDGLKVLVADDNLRVRRVCHDLLATAGCEPWEVDSAARGLQALLSAHADAEPFGLVLIDRELIELAAMIRSQKALEHVPLVLLHNAPGEQIAAPFAAAVAKPVKAGQLATAVATAIGIQQPAPLKEQENQPKKRKIQAFRVLIVEDNALNQKVAARILEKAGYRFDIASNGNDAITAVKNTAYDLILMDCQMPELDGYDATRAVREIEQKAGTTRCPIIAMTAEVLGGARERCLEAGMDDYLSKPIQPKALYTMIEQYLDTTSQPTTADLDLPPPIEIDRLQEASGGDEEFIKELADLYLEDSEHHLVLLEAAHRAGMLPELRREAHTIKGASGNVGAVGMHKLALAIEEAAATGSVDRLDESVRNLRSELGRVKRYFKARAA